MILRRVQVSNWRAVDQCEIRLGEGLTVVTGLNERGKSSLVEAIEWGLYRRPKQRWRGEDLQPLVPASRPAALPSVELDVETGDGLVTIKKVFAPDARRRSCELTIRPRGEPPEAVTDTETAQARWEELLGASGDSAALAVGRQGQADAFVTDGLPSPARNALTVNREGLLLPSARLERVRDLLTKERDALLTADLGRFRAGTEGAARERELQEKESELVAARNLLSSIEGLRGRIEELRQRLAASEPEEAATLGALEAERRRQRDQELARRDLTAAEAACQEKRGIAQQLEATLGKIRELRNALADRERPLARAAEQAAAAKARVTELEAEEREREGGRSAAATRLEDAIRYQQALHLAGEVERGKARLQEVREALRRLAALAEDLERTETQASALPPWPTNEQIRALRGTHRELEELLREARRKLQVDLILDRPTRIRWAQDAEPARTAEAGPGAPVSLGAVQRVEIVIEDVGRVEVRCGAAELAELLARIQQLTAGLDTALGPYGLRAADFLEGLRGFDELERRRIAGEEAQERVRAARRALEGEEGRVGKRPALERQLQEASGALVQAETRFVPLAPLVPAGLEGEPLRAELGRAQAAVTARREEVEEAAGRLAETQAALRAALEELGQRTALVERLQAEADHRQSTLTTLTADGLSDEAREAALRQAQIQLAEAEQRREAALEASRRLGDPVSPQALRRLEESLERIRTGRATDQKALHESLGELRTKCQGDPEGTLQRLEVEVPALRARRTLADRRARATALLVALLEADRRRIGRLMAGPLNEQLSPWMSAIRGVKTEIELDPGGERIERVRTYRDGEVEALPFSSLSGGTREQVALLMRLILARMIAAQSPQHRLCLVLDDPLSQSDDVRRPHLYRALRQFSDHVQIVFVTCHPDTGGLAPEQVIRF